MEIAMRRLEGVDKISISISKQTFEVSFKPGSSFRPWDLRDAVAKAEVDVVKFYVSARGQVKLENSKRYFLAGRDKFLLPDSPKVPVGVMLSVVGSVDDSQEPFQLRIQDFKPLR